MRAASPSEEPPMLSVERLVVRFDEVEAVAGISFAVGRGEAFALLGRNGAGKTTTIRVLTTLLRATAGRARVAGFDASAESLRVRASIGYVPQAISVDGALTALENLEFYARVSGVPAKERRARIERVIEEMELEAMLDRLARTLSGGMLRRLEIASALLGRPAVLFLDEPTVGLDPTARRVVWDRLMALRRQAGTTILFTTHMMEEAERYGDRVAIMARGRLVEQGGVAELCARHGAESLEDVFTAVTGHGIEDEEQGRLADARARRRVVTRLG